MKAAYLMEVKKWKEAIELLVRAKVIYQSISKMKDSIEAVIYKERIGQLDTFIRLCCVSLKQQSTQDLENKLSKSLEQEIRSAHKDTKQE